jgi:riboflavin synthase
MAAKAKIGIADTMFARVDMGAMAIDEIRKNFPDVEIIRRTVPGVKDLPVECKRLLDSGCDSCMAIGMVGGAPVDQVCAHEASTGIQQVKLLTNKHFIEVFVHENEAWTGKEFYEICENRVRKHAHNAVLLVTEPEALTQKAGRGVRQGKSDEGPVSLDGGRSLRIAIVVSDFNADITEQMEDKAVETINTLDAEHAATIHVAGTFDIPLAAKKLLMDKDIDAIVALGAVVKGETGHDEVIVKNTARALGDLSLEFRKPVGFGIIGHDAEYDAAEERADDYAERAVKAAVGLAMVLRK